MPQKCEGCSRDQELLNNSWGTPPARPLCRPAQTIVPSTLHSQPAGKAHQNRLCPRGTAKLNGLKSLPDLSTQSIRAAAGLQAVRHIPDWETDTMSALPVFERGDDSRTTVSVALEVATRPLFPAAQPRGMHDKYHGSVTRLTRIYALWESTGSPLVCIYHQSSK